MITIFGMLLMGLFNLLAFFMGVSLAQKLQNNEKISIPNPVKVVDEIKEEKASKEIYDKKQKQLETELANIENYSGDGIGQQDIPE